MKKIRAAVVGVGYLGKFHAEKYAKMDNVELVGVVDTHKAQAGEIAGNVGTTPFSDYRDLFGRVDAVSIAVPTPLHFEIGKAFLEHDIDVLIEKPITTTVEEADELIEISDRKNLVFQVGQLERFNPAVTAVQHIVDHPIFIESNRLGIYKERGTDVSVVLDLMIHDIDIILNFVRSGIKYCHAMGASVVSDNIDIANAHIEFDNGAVANVTASRISNKNERKIRLFQKDGYISVDFANRSIIHVRPGEEDNNCPIPGMHLEEKCFTDGDALEDEIRSFIHAVERREPPEVSGQMGRDALEIALSITQQIRKSSRIYSG
ncbi:MAG: Gfo/Idh/MocA family oxidoreductase [Desulfobacteraceae bacterium]|nr:Gfo/Idh/MocA family oxidoreductase [Desulfobacteraceae bacterium]